MEKKLDIPQNLQILSCPFLKSCNLPKSRCGFPEYKVCTDYQSKLNALRQESKVLH